MGNEISHVDDRRIEKIISSRRGNQLGVFAFVVSSVGAFFVASKDYGLQLIGFELWILSNLAWLVVGAREEDYSLMLTFGVYFCFNMWGIANRAGLWC